MGNLNTLTIPDLYSFYNQTNIIKSSILFYDSIKLPIFRHTSPLLNNIKHDIDVSYFKNQNGNIHDLLNLRNQLGNVVSITDLLHKEGLFKIEVIKSVDGTDQEIHIDEIIEKISSDLKEEQRPTQEAILFSHMVFRDLYTLLYMASTEQSMLHPKICNKVYAEYYEQLTIGKSEGNTIKAIQNQILGNYEIGLPNYESVNYEDILEIRQKFKDILIPARMHLAKLALDVRIQIKDEPINDQKKFITEYVQLTVNPAVAEFIKATEKEQSNKFKKILKGVAGFVAILFDVTKVGKAVAEIVKSGIELDESLKNELSNKKAFLKVMAKQYKKH